MRTLGKNGWGNEGEFSSSEEKRKGENAFFRLSSPALKERSDLPKRGKEKRGPVGREMEDFSFC